MSLKRTYAFIANLEAVGARELVAAGVCATDDEARAVAYRIAVAMCGLYARTQMYIPAVLEIKLHPRDQEIWGKYCSASPTARAYSSARVTELAAEYQLAEAHVYNILRSVRERETRERQGSLDLG